MKKIPSHKAKILLKQFLAIGLLFFVLISTCSIQRGIKAIFNVPMEFAQTAKGAKLAPSSQMRTNCTKCSDVQVLSIDASEQILKMGPSALVLTAIFFLFLGTLHSDRESQAILKTPTLSGTIPKYLLFSRLLFYDRK